MAEFILSTLAAVRVFFRGRHDTAIEILALRRQAEDPRFDADVITFLYVTVHLAPDPVLTAHKDRLFEVLSSNPSCLAHISSLPSYIMSFSLNFRLRVCESSFTTTSTSPSSGVTTWPPVSSFGK